MTLAIELRFEIEDLHTAYCAALDDGRYEEWPEFFAEDGLYRIVPRDNHDRGLPLAIMHCEGKGMMIDRVVAIRKTSYFGPRLLRHIVSGVRSVQCADGSITSEANYLVLQTLPDQQTELFNSGRYLDRIVREDGRLRFRERLCVFDSIVVPNSLIIPT